jgi:hypothetical protein
MFVWMCEPDLGATTEFADLLTQSLFPGRKELYVTRRENSHLWVTESSRIEKLANFICGYCCFPSLSWILHAEPEGPSRSHADALRGYPRSWEDLDSRMEALGAAFPSAMTTWGPDEAACYLYVTNRPDIARALEQAFAEIRATIARDKRLNQRGPRFIRFIDLTGRFSEHCDGIVYQPKECADHHPAYLEAVERFWQTVVAGSGAVKVAASPTAREYAQDLAEDWVIRFDGPGSTWRGQFTLAEPEQPWDEYDVGIFEVCNRIELTLMSSLNPALHRRVFFVFPVDTANEVIEAITRRLAGEFFWRNAGALGEVAWLWSTGQGAAEEMCFCARDRTLVRTLGERVSGSLCSGF